MSFSDLLILAAPIGAGAFGLLVVRARLASLGVVDARRRSPRRAFRRDLVEPWLRGSGIAPPRSPTRDSAVSAAAAVACVLLLVSLAYFGTVTFRVTVMSASLLSNGRQAADNWRRAFAADSTRPYSLRDFSDLAKQSAVPSRGGPPDLEAARLVLTRPFLRPVAGQPIPAALAIDLDGARRVQSSGPEPVGQTPDDMYKVLGDSVPPTLDRLLPFAPYAQSPWLDVWRRLASSADLPTMWIYREGAPGVASLWDMPIPRFAATKDLAYRNSIAGYLALKRGDIPSAILRGRETIGAGRQFLSGTSTIEALIGVVLVGIGSGELEVVARATHDQSLTDEMARLKAARMRWRRERLPTEAWAAMTADPRRRDIIALMAKLGEPSGFGSLLWGASYSYCLNPREVLFGPDPARAELLHAIAEASGIPRAAELERLARRPLHLAARGERDASMGVRILGLRPLSWIGAGGLRARIEACAGIASML